MRNLSARLRAEGIETRLEAAPASCANVLVAYAEACRADLIIAVGREANGGAYGRLVEELLRQAPCAAMALAAAPREAPAERQAGPQRTAPAGPLSTQEREPPGTTSGI